MASSRFPVCWPRDECHARVLQEEGGQIPIWGNLANDKLFNHGPLTAQPLGATPTAKPNTINNSGASMAGSLSSASTAASRARYSSGAPTAGSISSASTAVSRNNPLGGARTPDKPVSLLTATVDALLQFQARFPTLRILASGATGLTHKATDVTSNKAVAIKTYNDKRRSLIERLHDKNKLDRRDEYYSPCRIEIEIRYLRLCANRNPNVVALLGVFCDSELPASTAMVLEYAQLGDLHDFSVKAYHAAQQVHINEDGNMSGLPETLIWHWAAQMTSAVAFLHNDLGGDMALIHGDIKLENWLVFSPSQPSLLYGNKLTDPLPAWAYPDVKLADFDHARLATDAPRGTEGRPWGTPSSQAPEYPRDTKIGDVWSVGACLHRLLTDRYPIAEAPADTPRDKLRIWTEIAERKVVNVRNWGYSEDMDKLLRGSKWEPQDAAVGGLLNMDWQRRLTARAARELVEETIRSKLVGQAQRHQLGRWARATQTDDGEVEDSSSDGMESY